VDKLHQFRPCLSLFRGEICSVFHKMLLSDYDTLLWYHLYPTKKGNRQVRICSLRGK
jgi:hypothetical protein